MSETQIEIISSRQDHNLDLTLSLVVRDAVFSFSGFFFLTHMEIVLIKQ